MAAWKYTPCSPDRPWRRNPPSDRLTQHGRSNAQPPGRGEDPRQLGGNASRQANLPQIPTVPVQNRQLPVRACLRHKRLPASSVNARLWPAFLSALNAKAVLASPVHGIFMLLGSRVLEYLPRVVPSHTPAWVRTADTRCRAHACPQQAGLTSSGSFNVFRQTCVHPAGAQCGTRCQVETCQTVTACRGMLRTVPPGRQLRLGPGGCNACTRLVCSAAHGARLNLAATACRGMVCTVSLGRQLRLGPGGSI